MGSRRRNSRSGEKEDKDDGDKGSMKRSMERSGSPPRKRCSPYASPIGSPRVRSPSGSVRMTSPTAGTPRVGSPRVGSPIETENDDGDVTPKNDNCAQS